MTEQEIAELRELRIQNQILKDKIHTMETEIMDVDMRMNFLERSRHGKGLGLFIALVCFGLSAAGLISYALLYVDSSGRNMNGYAAAIVFSVTATMMPFLLLFVIIFALITMIRALFLVMDLYPSEGAYRSAVRFHRTNIPHEKRVCIRQREELEKSLGELKRECYGISDRLEELQNKEQKMFLKYTM